MNGRERELWERMALFIGLALDRTPAGFDVCFCDLPNRWSAYSANIATPRREGK